MEDKSATRQDSQFTTVFVFGYNSTDSTFVKEARTRKLGSNHWSLLLNAPVSCGQKLLLISGAGQDPVQGEVLVARSLSGQTFEVEVALVRKIQ